MSSSLSAVFALSSGVGGATERAAATLEVHGEASVLAHVAPFPACGGGQHLVDLVSAPGAHDGAKRCEQRQKSLHVAALPGPDRFPVRLFGLAPVDVAEPDQLGQALDHIFIGHLTEDAQEWARTAVAVATGCQVEAPLTFEQAGDPVQVAVIPLHMSVFGLLDLAMYKEEQ